MNPANGAHTSFPIGDEVLDGNLADWEAGVSAVVWVHDPAPMLRGLEVRTGSREQRRRRGATGNPRAPRRGQQLRAVDDLHDPGGAGPVGEVDAVEGGARPIDWVGGRVGPS